MIIIAAKIIVSPVIATKLAEKTARADSPLVNFAMRIIVKPRLPHDVYLTSGKVLVHGTEEYERLLAAALAPGEVQP